MGRRNETTLKLLNTLSFLVMVMVNALAVFLPINGVQTGQVSNAYPNLFSPAGVTFSIWGVIYLLLAVFIIYQLFILPKINFFGSNLIRDISPFFIVSSLANAAWVFSWHYRFIPLSMLLMLVILACLWKIVFTINRFDLSSKERIYVRLPFSVYFGWITVATIANFMVLLVSLGWNQWGLPEPFWTIFLLVLGLASACWIGLKNRDIAYLLVLIWAYSGIILKHVSAAGHNGQYPSIIVAAAVCIAGFIVAILYILKGERRKKLFF